MARRFCHNLFDYILKLTTAVERERAGLITRRTKDRNLLMLLYLFVFAVFRCMHMCVRISRESSNTYFRTPDNKTEDTR